MISPELLALQAKRDANIEKRNEASTVKMNYLMKAPSGYKIKSLPQKSPEESERIAYVERRREFNFAARRVFALLDKDKSLSVDPAELMEIATSAEAEDFVAMLDFDGDGKIQKTEWLEFMMRVWESNEDVAQNFLLGFEYLIATKIEADAAFDLFDLNSGRSSPRNPCSWTCRSHTPLSHSLLLPPSLPRSLARSRPQTACSIGARSHASRRRRSKETQPTSFCG